MTQEQKRLNEQAKGNLTTAKSLLIAILRDGFSRESMHDAMGCIDTAHESLDALEADGKCKYTKPVNSGFYHRCDKCGHDCILTNEKHCPGCGREIEATE